MSDKFSKFVSKFKWFWPWQDEIEEKWLREMSLRGYHLLGFRWPGFYHFLKGEPKNYVYRLDYKEDFDRNIEEYLELFNQSGWEYIGRYMMWRYFRTEASGDKLPDIYSDSASKINRNKKILGLSVIGVIALLSAGFMNIRIYLFSCGEKMNLYVGLLDTILGIIFIPGTLKVIGRNNKLKKEI
ncbi:MAG: DUF2812 domain-containing protein [Clostridia bacterium]|nr:DUF2812 domain-containing protein [Clostridia bacterium]